MKKIFLLLIFFVTLLFIPNITSCSNNENSFDRLSNEKHIKYLKEVFDNTISENHLESYSDYIVSYYDNLTWNLGLNYKGSSGYVAIGMLLSYYGTFLDDNIIPEQFDINSIGAGYDMIARRNSPGIRKDILKESYTDVREMNNENYLIEALQLENFSLHSKLISIGNSLGYIDFDDEIFPLKTNFNQRMNILKYYLENILTLKSDDYKLDYVINNSKKNNYDFRNFIINAVNNHKPVLLSIGNDIENHIVLAYDYNKDNDELYCHFGYGDDYTHVTIESQGFKFY